MVSGKFAVAVALVAASLFAFRVWMKGTSCQSTERLDGKVVIVTGANTGIGKETALDMVRRGARVYMACRSLDRGEAAAADIRQASGAGQDQVIVLRIDLGSLKSVRQFAQEFREREKHLHVLINNAGVMFAPYSVTEDGYELTFQVNHLGHFLLTNLLLDLLKTSAPSRIINVSSGGHRFANPGMDFDDLMLKKTFSLFKSYGQSKLANILFTMELGNRLKGTGVTTYSLHPGAIMTDLPRHIFLYDYALIREAFRFVGNTFLKNAKDGAQTTICCAVDPKLAKETGKYYRECAQTEPKDFAKDAKAALKLWEVSKQLVELN